jgi:type II secretory pathway predicted ATPase ExeA
MIKPAGRRLHGKCRVSVAHYEVLTVHVRSLLPFPRKPFQLSPDPRFFFYSRGHRRAMAYLDYGLHQGEGFIVITGEVGAGKTMLAQTLTRKLESRNW